MKPPAVRGTPPSGVSPDKPLVWLHGEIKTPPLSLPARIEAGVLLRRLQRGEGLAMPESRPMPSIGPRCHALRIGDAVTKREFRILYYIGKEAVVILEVFGKTTRATPQTVIEHATRRLRRYQALAEGGDQ